MSTGINIYVFEYIEAARRSQFGLLHQHFSIQTKGHNEVVDITERVADIVKKSEAEDGSCLVFVRHSTCAITTIEFEPGLVESDIQEALDRIAPIKGEYKHNKRWGDGNGYAHVRATIVGPSLTVPIAQGGLLLGTWQQIVLIDFDNRARERNVSVVISG